jgi:hypothetical protein
MVGKAFLLVFTLFFSIPWLTAQQSFVSPTSSGAVPCQEVVMDAFSPILLNDYAECYVTISDHNTKFRPAQLVATDDQGIKYVASYNKEEQYYFFPSLPQQQSFTVSYSNGCGKNASLGGFNTSYEAGRVISVSRNLYELIADISTNRKAVVNSFYEITKNTSIPDFEKASFIQRYFLKGRSVAKMSDLFDESVTSNKSLENCNCEQVIHQFWLNPGQLDYTSGNVLAEDPRIEDDDNKLEFQLRTAGAAKAWRVYSDGWREDRNTPYGGAVGSNGETVTNVDNLDALPDDFSLESRISMNLFCNGGATPRDCGCDKLAFGRVFYESQIGVRSQIGSGGGEKNAFAGGEDIALAYLLRRDGTANGSFEFLDAMVNTARDSCGRIPNEEFWSSAASAAVGIATLVASFLVEDTSSTLFNQTRLQLIGQIGDNLGTVFSTSASENAGECSTQLQVQVAPNRIDVQPEFTLQPNVPTELGIATRARLVSMGMRSWQSEVTLSSGFSLATVHPAGLASSGQDEECCVDRTEVSYISRAFDTGVPFVNQVAPVSPLLDLRVDAATFIRGRVRTDFDFMRDRLGRYFTRYEFGTAIASVRYDEGRCLLKPTSDTIGFISIGKHFREIAEEQSATNSIPFGSTAATYHFFTMDGRVVGSQSTEIPLTRAEKQESLRGLGLPSGVYIVRARYSSGQRPTVQKIYLNN